MAQQFPTALVTGAAGGLGQALAAGLAEQGYRLVLVDREVRALNQVAGQLAQDYRVPVKVLPQNLARLGAANLIVQELQAAQITLDVLVNNASLGDYGQFWQQDTGQMLAMIQVNIMALTHLTRLVLPEMIAADQGKILNVATTAASGSEPRMAVNAATKAYTLSFSETLAHELRNTGVTVTVLCPELGAAGLQDVAQAGVTGLLQGQGIVMPGLTSRFLSAALQVLPWPLRSFLVQR